MSPQITNQANELLHLCEVNRRWWRVRFEALAMAVGIVAAVLLGMTILDSGPLVSLDRIGVSGPPPTISHEIAVTADKGVVATWSTEVAPVSGPAGPQSLDPPICSSSGVFTLAPGDDTTKGSFDAVVGVPGCWDKLVPGETYLVCTREDWGDGETAYRCSPPFSIADLG